MSKISVCMIVKNEEARLEKCLASLAPYEFELIIVDTGSTDSTKEIAAKYTTHIYDFPWMDDFSVARNFSLEKASNNFIFMMDSDEWILDLDVEEMDYFIHHLKDSIGVVQRYNYITHPDGSVNYTIDQTERLFSKKLYHYVGRIHEQLRPIKGTEFPCLLLNTSIGHSGYDMTPEQREAKAKRNYDLLLLELEADPENPYLYYQLGKACEITADYEKALAYFDKGLSFPLDTSLAYVESMVIRFGSDLMLTGRTQDALAVTSLSENFANSADFAYLCGTIYQKNQKYKEATSEFLRALKFPSARLFGANSFLAYERLAEIMESIGDMEQAEMLRKQAKEMMAKC